MKIHVVKTLSGILILSGINRLALIQLQSMVTKFKNWSILCHFIAMETTFVLNNFPKTNICITAFLSSINKWVYTIFVIAMVTKFNNLN